MDTLSSRVGGGTLERAGSIQSLSHAPFNTSLSFGCATGTMSAISFTSETVPLAVAFCETVNAYFSGSGTDTRLAINYLISFVTWLKVAIAILKSMVVWITIYFFTFPLFRNDCDPDSTQSALNSWDVKAHRLTSVLWWLYGRTVNNTQDRSRSVTNTRNVSAECCAMFRCRLKITGDMIVSFPAGIVQALRNNPWSTALSLHVRNISHVDEILMNKQLISEYVAPVSNAQSRP